MIKKSIRVNIYIAVFVIAVLLLTQPASAAIPGLTSDLSYTFSNQTQTEYYDSGTAVRYNITEGTPGWVFDIIGAEPQTVYNSDFGINIILPSGNFDANPDNSRPQYAPATSHTSNSAAMPSMGFSPGSPAVYPDTSLQTNAQHTSFTFGETANPQRITPVSQVRQSSGSIGTLKISRIGLNITVYDGDATAAMLRGAAHIASTSAWNGNIGISGHNRGVVNNFGRLQELAAGDIIEYTTNLGTRKYKVTFSGSISETDWSRLRQTSDNRITLVTCIENVPSQRFIIQGVEIL